MISDQYFPLRCHLPSLTLIHGKATVQNSLCKFLRYHHVYSQNNKHSLKRSNVMTSGQ